MATGPHPPDPYGAQQPAPPPPPIAPGTGGPSGPRANFGRRLVAFLIDVLIFTVAGWFLSALLAGTAGTTADSQAVAGVALLLWLVLTVAQIAYFVVLEGGPSGQTLGKKVMDIRVIDFSTGGPLGYGKAFVRWIGRIPSTIVCYLGYLWMLWDRERQTWHDKIANTVVVPVSAYPTHTPTA